MATPSFQRRRGLTVAQLNAIDLLAVGATDSAVAERLKLARETVTRWRLYDPLFQAQLRARRAQIWASSVDAMRGALPVAIESVREQLLVGPNRGRLALDLITRAGIMGRPYSGALGGGPDAGGPTTVEEVLDSEIRRVRAKVAAQTGPQHSPLGPVDAPITPEERDAAALHFETLCQDSGDEDELDFSRDQADRALIDLLRAAHK